MTSTYEAELNALLNSLRFLLCLKKIMPINDTTIKCNNQPVLDSIKTPSINDRSKHLRISFLKIKEWLKDYGIKLEKISSKDNLADILTKPAKKIMGDFLFIQKSPEMAGCVNIPIVLKTVVHVRDNREHGRGIRYAHRKRVHKLKNNRITSVWINGEARRSNV